MNASEISQKIQLMSEQLGAVARALVNTGRMEYAGGVNGGSFAALYTDMAAITKLAGQWQAGRASDEDLKMLADYFSNLADGLGETRDQLVEKFKGALPEGVAEKIDSLSDDVRVCRVALTQGPQV